MLCVGVDNQAAFCENQSQFRPDDNPLAGAAVRLTRPCSSGRLEQFRFPADRSARSALSFAKEYPSTVSETKTNDMRFALARAWKIHWCRDDSASIFGLPETDRHYP